MQAALLWKLFPPWADPGWAFLEDSVASRAGDSPVGQPFVEAAVPTLGNRTGLHPVTPNLSSVLLSLGSAASVGLVHRKSHRMLRCWHLPVNKPVRPFLRPEALVPVEGGRWRGGRLLPVSWGRGTVGELRGGIAQRQELQVGSGQGTNPGFKVSEEWIQASAAELLHVPVPCGALRRAGFPPSLLSSIRPGTHPFVSLPWYRGTVVPWTHLPRTDTFTSADGAAVWRGIL